MLYFPRQHTACKLAYTVAKLGERLGHHEMGRFVDVPMTNETLFDLRGCALALLSESNDTEEGALELRVRLAALDVSCPRMHA